VQNNCRPTFQRYVLPTSSSLMMEAARTTETSVDNYFTRQYITEDNSEHHTRCRENLKSQIKVVFMLKWISDEIQGRLLPSARNLFSPLSFKFYRA
jgi:hypothetical protein